MALSGKLTKRLVENLGAGRHGDGNGLYPVVDPSGARRWIVRVVVKGQKNKKGAPLRTDFGLGGADILTINQARERALEYRRMAKQGLYPRFNKHQEIPTFGEVAQQVHIDRMPTWKSAKHGQQWINTLRDYAFPKIGRMPKDSIDQPEVMMCLAPIWTEKHETAKRLAQRIKTVLDVARSKGFRSGENPVTAIKDVQALPKVKAKVKHHKAMHWEEVPASYADLRTRNAMAAKALMFTCLTGSRTSEVLDLRWEEINFDAQIWNCPDLRMKTGEEHRVPLTDEMLAVIEPLQAMQSDYVFEGQKRHKPLSNMSMMMLLRRMQVEGVTVQGFLSTFRDWASEAANASREIAEKSLAHTVGSDVERAYARFDLLDKQRVLMERWSSFVAGSHREAIKLNDNHLS
ncbi:tyrosine-type recombinase/integrase [Sulfitobacter mediterraneus]|uniref:tyrosine-type recombinase/integrase n=1 Tax=Sulfitobacter mediterraneus TaxID=83219 RepID=UPI001933DDA1|nr:site-specific integrase [Sulfitobacter mediterraneus]MBM1311793.1 tyrosine-type recombinase/integrase [Sulfitobacter mediterraneus]MBM1315675.1 tyrosine-type recombinase/integrase [Sulfitobacter mediterraneus]MBM1324036.1 tyrosine-type recombinase/integrase [Sulfitobacter mediterraneus]MBM1327948.1 tyrosine-type recombinase/integrase [Sulfitobacter mediterraneus]MBM1399296.1 tyrosine-type recombinase/integrase [Sulfitobacter mediterraneus]